MTANSVTYDLGFRPDTYWPESRTPEQLLANIKGKVRRDIARRILKEEGFAALKAFFGREELGDQDRLAWGQFHPAMMGGEYLPGLASGEVEIARISLASTTGDQISVRARADGDRIGYSVVDEYEWTYRLPFATSEQPLTLRELIRLIDESGCEEDGYPGGLVLSPLNLNFDISADTDGLAGFVSVESAYYPELWDYYRGVVENWMDEHSIVEEEECE